MLLTFDAIRDICNPNFNLIPDGTYNPIMVKNGFDLMPVARDTGYFVSLPFVRPNRALPVRDFGTLVEADVEAELVRAGALLMRCTLVTDNYFGVWRDGSDLYVDLSVWVPNLRMALSLAQAAGELAIWDIAAGTALMVADVTGEVE